MVTVLEEARRRGFLGGGPVEEHIDHATALAGLVDPPTSAFLDLGTGAGIPGLVLALRWPGAAGALLDSRPPRTSFLEDALTELGLADRLTIIAARAEDAARDPAHRGRYELVVARSFGRPAVTAECAVGFLQPGGRLAVSEPQDTNPDDRWPQEALAQLGLLPPALKSGHGATVAILTTTTAPDEEWPRRSGLPTKRPLW